MDRAYPKGSWNVRIKCDIDTFVDSWMQTVNNGGNYGCVAKLIDVTILDVQFAEARLRKAGVNLPSLTYTDENDDREVICALV
jgi:hypothetical protein